MGKRKKKPVDLNRTWEVGLGRTALLKVSRREGFSTILALCRLVNMLKFATFGVYGLGESKSPFARRQSMISFSLSCALLYEAHTNILPNLRKHFEGRQVYEEGLAAWRADREVHDFIQNNCKEFRHKTVFHVEIDVPEYLARVESEWVPVLSSRGRMQGFYYYDLADQVALTAFLGEREAEDAKSYITGLASQATKVTKSFLSAADDLIRSVIKESPFRLRQCEDTQEPAWVTFQQTRDGVVPAEERPPRLSRPV